ncbi:hypothetical protein DTL21_19540 [Bremerella cremea]|uniref:Uncharacterized protein n=1 Tax=Blastopirellula marina TaxID=124 RepID=A0A2S8FJT2_9BACT|nr:MULTISPECIES: hypothetical protein [Pirellulaceae]PQO32413.1 hypothetical protein C5Y83_19520 [Blastopirellula marina]RCS45480.1 hypothetical protein DTL21_19540 [Bremerella cremea]
MVSDHITRVLVVVALAFTLLFVNSVNAAERVDAKEFEFARPFIESLENSMMCHVRYESGRVFVEVSLPNQKLVPRHGTGLPADHKMGIWRATFELVPKLDFADLRRIQAMVKPQESKQQGGIPVYAELSTNSSWFRVRYASYAPEKLEARRKIDAFVERLSVRMSSLTEEDVAAILKRNIIEP